MSYYFYDLETSGLNPKWHRIMQFAGQRTDENFHPVGEPDNWLVKITPDVLPDPEAILVTGITPQQTLQEGMTEPEFLKKLMSQAFTPGTTAMGYNTVRFDDEFMRYTLYRNFYDAYEREWSDNRSRWDIVDMVRMTRALRPDGIEWPVGKEGKPTNRLEELSKANGIEHTSAHDALSDVTATIGMTQLLKTAQPKLFEHLLSLKHKNGVKKFLEDNRGKPIIHSSSKFGSEFLATSAVIVIAPHPTNQNAVLAFDLRHSPKEFADMTPVELAERAFTPYKELAAQDKKRLPIKAIHMNKCPALAPLGVLDEASQERIKLPLKKIQTHVKELAGIGGFGDRVAQAWESQEFAEDGDVDAQLYGGFLGDTDRKLLHDVRQKDGDSLADWHPKFNDDRLVQLLLRYKARHYPESLSADERQLWEQYRAQRFKGSLGPAGINAYLSKLAQLYQEVPEKQKFLIEELQLYAQSILPYENESLV